jgi:hypothetical protein
VKSDTCLACDQNTTENLYHLIYICPFYEEIRQLVLTKLLMMNRSISNDVNLALDPQSNLLPDNVRNWPSIEEVYGLTRDMCYNIHRKREQFYNGQDL